MSSTDKDDPSELQGEDARRADAIERDIAHHRAEIGGALEELQHRLSPSHIAHEAVDAIKGRTRTIAHDTLDTLRTNARSGANTVVDRVRGNPVPYGILGAGVLLLLLGRRTSDSHPGGSAHRGSSWGGGRFNGSSHGRSSPGGASFSSGGNGLRGAAAQGRDAVVGAAGQTAGIAASAMHAVSGAASSVLGGIGSAASSVGGQAAATGSAAAGAIQQGVAGIVSSGYHAGGSAVQAGADFYDGTRRQVSSFSDDHPLVVMALGVALGAAVSGFIPVTEKENELLGEQRDALLGKVTDAGQDFVQQVTDTGLGLVDEAKRVATVTFDKARTTVQNELSGEGKQEG